MAPDSGAIFIWLEAQAQPAHAVRLVRIPHSELCKLACAHRYDFASAKVMI